MPRGNHHLQLWPAWQGDRLRAQLEMPLAPSDSGPASRLCRPEPGVLGRFLAAGAAHAGRPSGEHFSEPYRPVWQAQPLGWPPADPALHTMHQAVQHPGCSPCPPPVRPDSRACPHASHQLPRSPSRLRAGQLTGQPALHHRPAASARFSGRAIRRRRRLPLQLSRERLAGGPSLLRKRSIPSRRPGLHWSSLGGLPADCEEPSPPGGARPAGVASDTPALGEPARRSPSAGSSQWC